MTSGVVAANEVFYVGGTGKVINGAGSTSLASEKFIRAIDVSTTTGDGLGNAGGTAGVMGNGGSNADGIGVFSGLVANITNAIAPIDAVFYGTAVGTAKPASGGCRMPVNDRYNGGIFGDSRSDYLFSDPGSGAYMLLTGSPRSATQIASPTDVKQLPVTYLEFNARYTEQGMVSVTWATAAETDNARFEVERSTDATTYRTLGNVPGRGNTATRQNYTFTDEAPAPGWNYYRLRQEDYDGTASVSRPVAVLNENGPDNVLRLFPNPARAEVQVQLPPGEAIQQATIISAAGQRMPAQIIDNKLIIS